MNKERIYKLVFASVYPLYIKKAEAKGRTKEEVDAVIYWLTGYDKKTLQKIFFLKSWGHISYVVKPFNEHS